MLTDKLSENKALRYMESASETAWFYFGHNKDKAHAFGTYGEVWNHLCKVYADNKSQLLNMSFYILTEEHNASPIVPDEDDKLSAYMAARKASRNQ
jgi:hypothetical protein